MKITKQVIFRRKNDYWWKKALNSFSPLLFGMIFTIQFMTACATSEIKPASALTNDSKADNVIQITATVFMPALISNQKTDTPTSNQKMDPSEQRTSIVESIVTSPEQYNGQTVEIIGYFHGWNVLQELNHGPPKTRSDWVIADASGAIYVTGMPPGNLDPSSHTNINTIIYLVGVVQMTPERMAYILAKEIKLNP